MTSLGKQVTHLNQSELSQASSSCPLASSALQLHRLSNPQSFSLSLFLLHHQCLLSTPLTFSVSLFPFLCRLTFLPCCKGASTASLTVVPVFAPPSSSRSAITQCVLPACTELAPSRDDEGMEKEERERRREMKLRTGEEHLGYFLETKWKTKLHSWTLKLINKLA